MKDILSEIKKLDRKVITIFLSIAVLQTLSWYYASRLFFKQNLSHLFNSSEFLILYEYLYWFFTDILLLLFIPLLVILFFFKEKPDNYGLMIGDYKAGLKISFYAIFISIPVIWFATSSFENYPTLLISVTGFPVYIYFASLFFYMIAWEFIWRGYMLFGLFEKFGYYALFIQMIPFVILHNGKPAVETFGAIAGGLLLGVIALRTKSILYPVIIHFFVIAFTESLYYIRSETSEFGIGFSSIIKIISNLF